MNERIELVNDGNLLHCDSTMSCSDYEQLRQAAGTEVMTPEKVVEYATKHFGFDTDKIEPQFDMPLNVFVPGNAAATQPTRYSIERPPLYNATDWNYMRFKVCSITWEVNGGDLFQVAE